MALNNLGLGLQITAKDAASAVINNTGKSVDKLAEKSETANLSMMAGAEKMGQWGAAMMGIGKQMLGGLGLAAQEAGKFEKGVAEVASIADKAQFPLSTIEKISKEMAGIYGGDLNLQTKTLYQAISSGATTAAQSVALMHEANKLAIGGLSDSFKAVDALTNVLNAYGMGMEKAKEVSDAMFVATNVGKTTIDEMAHVIGRVAPTAALAGISMDEMMSAVAAASSQLGNGAEAVTGLKAAIANILKPTSDASAEAARLGIKFTAASLRSKGLVKFLDEITHSAKFNKDSMVKLFGSVEALNTISALTANNSASFNTALDAMAKKTGAADYAFNTLAQTAEFAQGVLKTNLQVALVDIGKVIAPLIGKVLAVVNDLVKKFNALSPSTKKIITYLFAFAGAALLIVGAVLSAAAAIAGLVAAKAAIIATLKIALVMFAAAAAAVLIVGVAIAGLKIAFDKNLGGIADAVVSVYKKIKLFFQALTQLFESGAFSGAVLKELEAGNKGVEDFAVTVFLWWNRIKNFWKGLTAGFEAGIVALAPVFAAIKNAIKGIAEELGFSKDGAGEARSKWEAFGEAGSKVGAVLAGAFGLVARVVEVVLDVFHGLVKGFKFAAPAFSVIVAAFKNLFAAVGNIVGSFKAAVSSGGETGSTFKTLGVVVGVVAGVVVRLATAMINNWAMVYNVIAGVVGGVVGMFASLIKAITGVAAIVKGILTGDLGLAFYGFKMVVFSVVKSVISMVTMMFETLAALVDGIAAKVGMNTGLQKAVQGAKGSVLGSLEKAMGLDKPYVAPTGPQAPAGAAGVVSAATGPLPPGTPNKMQGTGENSPGVVAEKGGYVAPGSSTGSNSGGISSISSTIQLVLDGAKIAEVVAKQDAKTKAATFSQLTPQT